MNTLITQSKWRVSKARDMKYGELYIPCKYGVIRQYNDGDLDIWITNSRIAKRMANLWPVKKDWDGEALFIRPFSDLDIACKNLKARKKRQVSPETLLKLREALTKARMVKKGNM